MRQLRKHRRRSTRPHTGFRLGSSVGVAISGKQKYRELKAESGDLERRVADVTKSREKWRDEAEELRRRVKNWKPRPRPCMSRPRLLKKTDLTSGSRPG